MSTARMSLDGEWSLRWCEPGEGEEAGWPAAGVSGEEAITARVPGMTQLDLFKAGEIPDPLFGRNAEDLEWMIVRLGIVLSIPEEIVSTFFIKIV